MRSISALAAVTGSALMLASLTALGAAHRDAGPPGAWETGTTVAAAPLPAPAPNPTPGTGHRGATMSRLGLAELGWGIQLRRV
jgi:hypothetical protein